MPECVVVNRYDEGVLGVAPDALRIDVGEVATVLLEILLQASNPVPTDWARS